MPVKHLKCCCCPECVITPQRCCKCVPKTICFTLAGPSEECSVEIDYSPASDSWTGSVTCFDETVNFVLLFDKDEDGACYLGLRSEELGIGEGYEQKWYISEYFPCELMTGSVEFGEGAEFRFEPVDKVKPFNCTGCKCLCECMCLFVRYPSDNHTCAGKLCWDYQSNAWIGEIVCQELYEDVTYEARLEFHPRGEFCDRLEDEDPYCDPYDETCILVLQIPGLGIIDHILDLPEECEERNIEYDELEIVNDEDETLVISIRCAACNTDCENGPLCPEACPDDPRLPTTLTVEVYYGMNESFQCINYGEAGYPGTLVGEYPITWSGVRSPCDLILYQGIVPYPSHPLIGDAPEGWFLDLRFLCCGPAAAGRLYTPGEANPYPWGDPANDLSDASGLLADPNTALFCQPFELHAQAQQMLGSDTYCFNYIVRE